MKTILYIHGYGSNGNATKALRLKAMLPNEKVLTPDFDYNHRSFDEIQSAIKDIIESEHVDMLLGSSLGGYHSICAMRFFEGPVWCVNPVTNPVPQFEAAIIPRLRENCPQLLPHAAKMLESYGAFQQSGFDAIPQRPKQLNLALSTNDETLGDHSSMPQRFPLAGQIVWKDNSGHHFTRFPELEPHILETLKNLDR